MRDCSDINQTIRELRDENVIYHFSRDYLRNVMKDAADAIEELLAKDTNVPNKWISVEERLPEDGKDVLCWYEYYHWNKEKMLPEYGIGYCINGHWGGEVSNGRDCKVLYWMPLPEPPKGVE